MTSKKYGYEFKFLPASRLAELLLSLPEGALVSTNMVHNLSVFQQPEPEQFEQIAWIDLLRDGEVVYE